MRRSQTRTFTSLTYPTVAEPAPSAIVRLSSNENPYGPSPKALQAMTDAFGLACRYPDDHAELLIDALAKINGVNRDQILLGDGSGEILKLCAVAFTGPAANGKDGSAGRGKLVVADPTFEAILAHAKISGAEIVKIPLNAPSPRSSQDDGGGEGRTHLHLQPEQSHRQHHARRMN